MTFLLGLLAVLGALAIEVAAERNSTLVLPFPVELLRFLERVTPSQPAHAETPGSLDQPADRVDDSIVARPRRW